MKNVFEPIDRKINKKNKVTNIARVSITKNQRLSGSKAIELKSSRTQYE